MISLTVFFDDPWWVGVVVCDDGASLRAYRHIFGGEPSPEEVYHFVLYEFISLTNRPAAGLETDALPTRRVNPKRAAREAARLTAEHGITTRAQEALRVARETEAREREVLRREQLRLAEEEKYERTRARARERHRGR